MESRGEPFFASSQKFFFQCLPGWANRRLYKINPSPLFHKHLPRKHGYSVVDKKKNTVGTIKHGSVGGDGMKDMEWDESHIAIN